MNKVILLRFGELFLKGKNKSFFETALYKNVKTITAKFSAKVEKSPGRLIVFDVGENAQALVNRIKNVFGLVSLSVADEVNTSLESIKEYCSQIKIKTTTFKIQTKRADKRFPLSSYELSAEIGGVILDNNKDIMVDVNNPGTTVNIDIRENGKTYIYYEKIPCVGGLPLGTAGRGLLLLSGGIDSPVAGFKMAKRGLSFDAVHFESFPYTSVQAKDKVIELANKLSGFVGSFKLIIVPFTKIQEAIHKTCDDNYMVILVRRFMMKIAQRLAHMNNLKAIITGENLAQVASQTVESITVTNDAVKTLPIFRPLIAYDKVEIVEISKYLDTYETSILPYEDCCSVFLPESPVTKPKLEKVILEEEKLDVAALINDAIANAQQIIIKAN